MKLKHRMYLFAGMICLDCLLCAALFMARRDQAAGRPVEAGLVSYEAYREGDSGEDKVERKLVALTFDDGPHKFYTEQLLDGLKVRGVKATFFLIGESIDGNEELVKRMSEEGHLIGNHTFHHVQLTKETKEQAMEEVEMTNQKIFQITGKLTDYIRPPFGSWNEELAEEIDMTTVMWSVDPRDWKNQNSGSVTSHIIKNAKDSDIILLHDIFPSSVDAALQVVDRLQELGYTFVTVEDLMIE